LGCQRRKNEQAALAFHHQTAVKNCHPFSLVCTFDADLRHWTEKFDDRKIEDEESTPARSNTRNLQRRHKKLFNHGLNTDKIRKQEAHRQQGRSLETESRRENMSFGQELKTGKNQYHETHETH
jgi:hypothetical protein